MRVEYFNILFLNLNRFFKLKISKDILELKYIVDELDLRKCICFI